MAITLKINGASRTVDADESTPLLWVLRDNLDLKASRSAAPARFTSTASPSDPAQRR